MEAAVGRRPSGRSRESQRTWYSGSPASSTKSSVSPSGFITKRVPPFETGTPGSGVGTAAAAAADEAAAGFADVFSSRRMPKRLGFAAASSSGRWAPAAKSARKASFVVWARNMSGEVTASAACGAWNGAGRDQAQLLAAASHESGRASAGGGTNPTAATRRTPLCSVRRTAGQPRASPEKRSRPTRSAARRRFAPPPIVIVFVFVSWISIQAVL